MCLFLSVSDAEEDQSVRAGPERDGVRTQRPRAHRPHRPRPQSRILLRLICAYMCKAIMDVFTP